MLLHDVNTDCKTFGTGPESVQIIVTLDINQHKHPLENFFGAGWWNLNPHNFCCKTAPPKPLFIPSFSATLFHFVFHPLPPLFASRFHHHASKPYARVTLHLNALGPSSCTGTIFHQIPIPRNWLRGKKGHLQIATKITKTQHDTTKKNDKVTNNVTRTETESTPHQNIVER